VKSTHDGSQFCTKVSLDTSSISIQMVQEVSKVEGGPFAGRSHRGWPLPGQARDNRVPLPLPFGYFSPRARIFTFDCLCLRSVYYMWRITGDQQWQDRGWRMFTSWMEACTTTYGFADLAQVDSWPPQLSDKQESFRKAETDIFFLVEQIQILLSIIFRAGISLVR
ncbi:hypothetical protein VP01_1243g2, partial [Puccinia sorghi]